MKSYLLEKIKIALKDVENSFVTIIKNLEHPGKKELELFYKIQVDLIILAALLRIELDFSKEKIYIECFEPIEKNKKSEKYFYRDDFNKIGTKTYKKLEKICNYILHRQSARFTDNRPINGKQQKNTKLLYYLQTDEMCKNCKLVNNYKPGNKYKYKKYHISTEDCMCGLYLNLGDFIKKIKSKY